MVGIGSMVYGVDTQIYTPIKIWSTQLELAITVKIGFSPM